jgi:hypothetical protein
MSFSLSFVWLYVIHFMSDSVKLQSLQTTILIYFRKIFAEDCEQGFLGTFGEKTSKILNFILN